jgi:hypothetical protein
MKEMNISCSNGGCRWLEGRSDGSIPKREGSLSLTNSSKVNVPFPLGRVHSSFRNFSMFVDVLISLLVGDLPFPRRKSRAPTCRKGQRVKLEGNRVRRLLIHLIQPPQPPTKEWRILLSIRLTWIRQRLFIQSYLARPGLNAIRG